MITNVDEDRVAEIVRAYSLHEDALFSMVSVLDQMVNAGMQRLLAYQELNSLARVVARYGEKGCDAAAMVDKAYPNILGRIKSAEHRQTFFSELNKRESLPSRLQNGHDLLTLAHDIQFVVSELSMYHAGSNRGEKIPTQKAPILKDASRRFRYAPDEQVRFTSSELTKFYRHAMTSRNPDMPTEEELQRLTKMFDAANFSSTDDINMLKLLTRIAYRSDQPAEALKVLQKAVLSYHEALEDTTVDGRLGTFTALDIADRKAKEHTIDGLEARIDVVLFHRR